MKLDMQFSESLEAEMNVALSESSNDMDAKFGEIQTIYNGQNGLSAYEVAVKNGYDGTETEWLASLKGEQGEQGPKGEKGDTGAKGDPGSNGKDGYTPRKGVDYFDGQPGKDGKDGVNGKDGYTPVKGVDYFDGKDGAPGADGKDGQPGKDGQDGSPGKDGADGYTPVKGTDYFTEADKAEMVADVLAEIPGNGGGVETLIVHITYDENEDTYHASATAPEIWEHTRRGGLVYCQLDFSVNEIYTLAGVEEWSAIFERNATDENWTYSYYVYDDGSVEVYDIQHGIGYDDVQYVLDDEFLTLETTILKEGTALNWISLPVLANHAEKGRLKLLLKKLGSVTEYHLDRFWTGTTTIGSADEALLYFSNVDSYNYEMTYAVIKWTTASIKIIETDSFSLVTGDNLPGQIESMLDERLGVIENGSY